MCPSLEENEAALDALLGGSDLLATVIRGHQHVDTALTLLLAEALPAPHEVELQRLTFPLKLDLAIGLRLLRPESRSLYLALNRVRNRFAHDSAASFDASDAADLWNVFSDAHRAALGESASRPSEPRDVLTTAIAMAFADVTLALELLQDHKLYTEVLSEVLQERLRPYLDRPDRAPGKTRLELERRYAARRKALRGAGST